MKNRVFKNIGYWLKCYKDEIVQIIVMVVLCIVVFIAGFFTCMFAIKDLVRDEVTYWETMTTAPEPNDCSLCHYGNAQKHHAPCIINLSTGEIAELRVYEPHPTEVGEVSSELKSGHHDYSFVAGVTKIRNQDLEKCEARFSEKLEAIDPTKYCYNCRRILADVNREGYVLVDLYDPDNIAVYKIWDGAKYIIRDYLVTSHHNKNKDFIVEAHGLLNLAETNQES